MRTLLLSGLFLFSVITTTTSTHHNPWSLSAIKKNLNTFGYLPADSNSSFNDVKIDTAFLSAVLAYQKFFHLNATGILDPATINQIMMPRCGVPDLIRHNSTLHGRNLYSSFEGTPKWPADRRNLKYHFTSHGTRIPQRTLSRIFARSFSRWERVTLVTFQRVYKLHEADIVLRFNSGDHGDGVPFDGAFGVLAHAFAPTTGQLHFDADETWAVSKSMLRNTPKSFDLETVTTHELGHILGLGHSTVSDAVMYPSVAAQTRKLRLHSDDVKGIQVLYGVRS